MGGPEGKKAGIKFQIDQYEMRSLECILRQLGVTEGF